MNFTEKKNAIIESLEDGKGRDIVILDVTGKSNFTDMMIVATGTSTTHVRSLGNRVGQDLKDAGEPAMGQESSNAPDWALLDFNDILVHVMTAAARERYALEELWTRSPADES